MSFLRNFLWFEKGELREIATKLFAQKWGYEARWESEVLIALCGGVVMAFLLSVWLGMFALLWTKWAIQSLNKKKFFDPLP